MRYIGKDMRERMDLLGLTADEVANKAFMEEGAIEAILQNRTAFEEIDEFDMSLICSVLHCEPAYFTDEKVKEKDLLTASMNRGSDTKKSRKVKAQIQDFMRDFAFISDVLAETEGKDR